MYFHFSRQSLHTCNCVYLTYCMFCIDFVLPISVFRSQCDVRTVDSKVAEVLNVLNVDLFTSLSAINTRNTFWHSARIGFRGFLGRRPVLWITESTKKSTDVTLSTFFLSSCVM